MGGVLGNAKTVGSIQVEVKANITIPHDTAVNCLRLLEMYLNADKTRMLITRFDDDKGYSFEISEKT